MELMGASSVTAPSLITGIGAPLRGSRSRRNNAITSATSQVGNGQKKSQRKSGAAAEDVNAVERLVRIVTDVVSRERRNLVLASLVSSIADVQSALAVSYDDVVGSVQEAASSTADSVSFELPELPQVDTFALTDFVTSNPLAIVGGGAALALPLILSNITKKPEGYGTVSAKVAYEKLADKEASSQLLDIRVGDDIKSEGTPDLKKYRKRVLQLPFTGESDAYLAKVLRKYKDAENTTIYVLDRFDGNSAAVAKLLAKGGFKEAYAIKDGAEGPSGWQASDLPWLVPSKGFSLDLGSFKDLISSSESGSIVPTTLGVAAAAGVGLVVFSEAETALQLLGSAALVQVFIKKFLFAKDRKKTIEELQIFLDTKIAPKELVEELKGIAGVLLPKFEEVQGAPVNGAAILETAAEAVPASINEAVAAVETSSISETPAVETTSISETPAPPEASAPAEVEPAAPEDPKAEEKELVSTASSSSSTDLPRTPRPLSPYPQYGGLKPPTSPTPQRP